MYNLCQQANAKQNGVLRLTIIVILSNADIAEIVFTANESEMKSMGKLPSQFLFQPFQSQIHLPTDLVHTTTEVVAEGEDVSVKDVRMQLLLQQAMGQGATQEEMRQVNMTEVLVASMVVMPVLQLVMITQQCQKSPFPEFLVKIIQYMRRSPRQHSLVMAKLMEV